ncbi:MAG: hypothetical protein J6S96_02130 [Muribaculaceae bacterium]|nr:hypothetical protein [Muribaculaceae bacterium]
MGEALHIKPFAVTSGQYMRPMLRMFFGRNWWWFVVPILIMLGLMSVLHDARWLIVCLMLIFMIFPMILILIYFNYALTLEVRWSIMEKAMMIDDKGLHLTFSDERMHSRDIAWSDISSITRDRNAFYFHLNVRRYNYVMLPCSVLADNGISEHDFSEKVKTWFNAQFSAL